MKYLIHAVSKRMWYVRDYLIPSMNEQGITDIEIALDDRNLGNLQACLNAFKRVPDDNESTVHLQDDVIIAPNFREVCENDDSDIMCGFCSIYDKSESVDEYVSAEAMWYSFPCIKIRNNVIIAYLEWYLINTEREKYYIAQGKHDDLIFRHFIQYLYQTGQELVIRNVRPNIVNHIDHLIGGSVCNQDRSEKIVTAKFWEHDDLVENLRKKLNVPLDNE